MAFTGIVIFVGVLVVAVCGKTAFQRQDIFKFHKELTRRIFQKRQPNYKTVRPAIGKGAAVSSSDSLHATAKVETTSGIVIGRTTEEGHGFYEIPYAEPPVGELRWKEPQPISKPLPEINATTNHYLHCYVYPGICTENVDGLCPAYESEDCLVLNVFIPNSVKLSSNFTNPPSERLPVLFYIHGGSFKMHSGTGVILHGAELAKVTNTVVVTINYRLGALGFLLHEETGQEDIKGNQGFKDQRLAMHWVQDNIAKFGGDKNRVTLFGNSAGAQSVALHTVSPKSKELFSSAIQQSNPHVYSFYYPDREVALRITNRFVKAMGCNGSSGNERKCLINATAEEVMQQMELVETQTGREEHLMYDEETFLPIIDGEEFTEQLSESYRTGKWNKDKSMIIGVNTQESEDTQYYFDKNVNFDEDAFTAYNKVLFGEETGRIITEKYRTSYPPPEDEDYRVTLGMEMSHYIFDCPSRLMARYASSTTDASLFFYANSHPVLNSYCVDQNNGNKTGCYLAYHASEITYVFRTVPKGDDFTKADQEVEDEFSTYWGSFARTSDPSKGLENSLGNFASWPEYTSADTDGNQQPWSHMHITAPATKVESAYREDICDFWDGINYGISNPTAAPVKSTTSKGHTAYNSWFGIFGLSVASFWISLNAVVE